MSEPKFNPYVGLRPFQADENLLFFGRDRQTLELLQRLHHHRFVAVVGGSGSGKSSLIRAGLIPALKGGYLVEDSSKWVIATMKPGQSPIYNLAETVLRQIDAKSSKKDISELIKNLKRERATAIIKAIAPLRKEKNANFFLLIDQFEELFRFSMDRRDSKGKTDAIDFVNLILDLSNQKNIPFYVVLTMRSDFIGDCAQFRNLPEAMNKSQYLVPRITRQQLKKIIEGPARLYGGKVNPALTTRLINDLAKVKDELPLVQHALMRMWDHDGSQGNSGELNFEDYEQIGGVKNALSMHADEAYHRMDSSEATIAKEMFQALTAIDENGRKIRRPLLLSDLKKLTGHNDEELNAIIDNFIKDKRSFLIVENVGEDGDKVIDISHESLIRQWNRLNYWVDEENDAASHYLQLAEATQLHRNRKKDHLTGSELAVALNWRDTFKPTSVWANRYKNGFDACMTYLNESKAEHDRIQKVERNRKKRQLFLISAVLALVSVFAVFAVISRNNAVHKKDAFELHFKAKVLESKNPTLALRLEEKAIQLYDYPEFSKSARDILNNHSFYKIIVKDTARFSAVAVTKDYKTIVTGDENGYISVWNAQGELLSNFKAYDDAVISLTISPDEQQLFSVSGSGIPEKSSQLSSLDGTISKDFTSRYVLSKSIFSPRGKHILGGSQDSAILMNLDGGIVKKFTNSDQKYVTQVLFSPNGEIVVTADTANIIRLWNRDGTLVTSFYKSNTNIHSVAFSPKGDSLLVGYWDATATLFDLEGEILQHFNGHIGTILAADIAADGQTFLTGSFDNTARLWDRNGNMIKEFKGHDGEVKFVGFSPDGKSVLTAARDGVVRSWKLEGVIDLAIHGYGHAVRSVRFSRDGNQILTGSHERAQVWDLAGELLENYEYNEAGMIYSAEFSPDEKMILTGSVAGSVELQENRTPNLNQRTNLSNSLINVRSVDFSPDGGLALVGTWGGTIQLIDMFGTIIKEIELEKPASSVAFSHDGKSFIAGSYGKTIRWDLDGTVLNEYIEPSRLFVNAVAFSPDDKYVVTGSNDHGARLWDMNGTLVQEFTGPRGAIRSVAFAPDGKSLITGHNGGTAREWDLNGTIINEYKGNQFNVFSVDYAPDGRSIVIGSGRSVFVFKRLPLSEMINDSIEPLSEAQKKEYGIDW